MTYRNATSDVCQKVRKSRNEAGACHSVHSVWYSKSWSVNHVYFGAHCLPSLPYCLDFLRKLQKLVKNKQCFHGLFALFSDAVLYRFEVLLLVNKMTIWLPVRWVLSSTLKFYFFLFRMLQSVLKLRSQRFLLFCIVAVHFCLFLTLNCLQAVCLLSDLNCMWNMRAAC